MDMKRIVIYSILLAAALGLATLGFTSFGVEGLLIPMGLTFAYFTTIFIIATIIKNNSIVDIGWGYGVCDWGMGFFIGHFFPNMDFIFNGWLHHRVGSASFCSLVSTQCG